MEVVDVIVEALSSSPPLPVGVVAGALSLPVALVADDADDTDDTGVGGCGDGGGGGGCTASGVGVFSGDGRLGLGVGGGVSGHRNWRRLLNVAVDDETISFSQIRSLSLCIRLLDQKKISGYIPNLDHKKTSCMYGAAQGTSKSQKHT